MQKIRRLLLIAERYVASIEKAYSHGRKIVPHAVSFHGQPVKIKVVNGEGAKKEEFDVDSHTNESVGAVHKKIADMHAKLPPDQITLSYGTGNGSSEFISLSSEGGKVNKESYLLVGNISAKDNEEEQTWVMKTTDVTTTKSGGGIGSAR